jgi:hypothetical protein
MKQITGLLDTGKKQVQDRDIYSSILQDLTFYMGRLTKNIEVSSSLLIDLAAS